MLQGVVILIPNINELLDTAHNKKYDTSISIYKADYISGEIKIQEKEISEASWFPIEEALSLPLAFNIKVTIEKILLSSHDDA